MRLIAELRPLSLLMSLMLGACATTDHSSAVRETAVPAATVVDATPQPPVAKRIPHDVVSPAGTRVDPYYWLRDDTRSSADVLGYLKAENAYTDAMLAHTKPMQDLLYSEIVARIKQDDATVPVFDRGYWRYVRYEEGKEYPIYARRAGRMEAPEQVLLDGNALAQGHDFFSIGDVQITDSGTMLAYTVDTIGRRQWTLKFKNLETGEVLADEVKNVEDGVAWANDGRTVLYVEKDPVTLLSTRVRKHVLGTDASKDALVYEESDHSFYLGVYKSRSHRYLNIVLSSTVSTEQRVARADDPALRFEPLIPRERDHEYEAEDLGDRWILRSNWKAKNFRIVSAAANAVADRAHWTDVVAHRDDAFVDGFDAFRDFLAVSERSGGLRKIRIVRWAGASASLLSFDEPAYTARIGDNPEQNSPSLRYVYTSLTTPNSTYDLDVASGKRTLRKRDPVLGSFDSADYVTEFVQATARDGTKVPVSIVYRAGMKKDGTAPMLQYAYGSYGASTDPTFSSTILSLVDRGFVYAVAHIRGGQELGRQWYDDGKLLNKQHTFTDFVDVTDFLVAAGYAAKDKVFARGGSAGGLLMGAVANLAPEKYRGITAHVPFVDVVTTMLDESIPLTTNEFDEWGNPKQQLYYDYMLSYSPYDNVGSKDYPAMLVTTGLWDSQVQYFEPAKWVAKLRAVKTDQHPLIFKIDMEAGHGGKSGRFQRYHELALEYAFMFDVLGIDLATGGASTTVAAH